MAQEIEMPEEEMLPMLNGARFYLAVPEPGQRWQMAIFDSKSGQWRAVSYQELQRMAQQMGGA